DPGVVHHRLVVVPYEPRQFGPHRRKRPLLPRGHSATIGGTWLAGDRAGVHRLSWIDAEGDDAPGIDAQEGLLDTVPEDGLAPFGEHLGGPADLNHPGLPGRQDVVYDDAGAAAAAYVADLLRLAHPQATDVNGVVFWVVAVAGGHHVGLPVRPDCRNSAEPLTSEVLDFLLRECAHATANRTGAQPHSGYPHGFHALRATPRTRGPTGEKAANGGNRKPRHASMLKAWPIASCVGR